MVKLGIAVIAEEDWRVRIAAGQAPPRVALIFVAADGASDDVDDAAATAQLQDSIKVDHYPCCIRLVPACTLVGVIDRIDTTQCVHDLPRRSATNTLTARSIDRASPLSWHWPKRGNSTVAALEAERPGALATAQKQTEGANCQRFFWGFF